MSLGACQQQASCGKHCVEAPQPGSPLALARQAWNGSCACEDAALSYATLQQPNVSCLVTLVNYAFAPADQAQAQTCLAPVSAVDQGVTTAMLCLYFGVPFLLLLTVAVRKLMLDRTAWVTAPEKDQELEEAASALPSTSAALDVRALAHLSFQNVKYVVSTKSGPKDILKGITGEFPPSTLTAVMGPSGCGKSSLLDVLASRGRGQGPGVSGRILVNGARRGAGYKRISAYVEQFDALFPYLTVREMLSYSAELRLDASPKERAQAVESVIRDLELMRCADTLIGDPARVRGISGGQSRRVTVGVELLGRPSILYLDEPTTGLDSASAMQLVQTLKNIAKLGCTVAATIHQPRSTTFAMFDRLLLMKAGTVVYCGPLSAIPDYIKAKVGISVPSKVNLADFLVDLMYTEASSDALKTVDRLAEQWANSEEAKLLEERVSHPSGLPPPFKDIDMRSGQRFARSLPLQVDILLRRSYLNMSRNRGFFVSLAMQNAQFIFYCLLFLGLRTENPSPTTSTSSANVAIALDPVSVYTRNFLYQVMNTMCILESVIIASAFMEKNIFLREHAAGAYSTSAYHAAWFIRLQVEAIGKGLLAAALCYFGPPTQLTPQAFFFFAVTLMVVSTVGSALAFFMSVAFSDAEGAANIHNSIIGFVGVYCGFYLPSRLIPIFTLWCYYLSFLTYSFEALELNQFGPCASYAYKTQTISLNLSMNQWTNLLVIMAWCPGFHLLALGVSLLRLRTRAIGDMQQPPVDTATKSAKSMEKPEEPAKDEGESKHAGDPGSQLQQV